MCVEGSGATVPEGSAIEEAEESGGWNGVGASFQMKWSFRPKIGPKEVRVMRGRRWVRSHWSIG